MIGKKINQLATELAPVSTDLTIIGDPISGVSKKITIAQLGAIFSGAVSFYTNLAGFPALGDINVIYCAKDTKKLYLWDGTTYVEVFPAQALLDTYQLRSEKGVSNGYASLDSGGKVPISQLPSSIMEYKGTWNAATNTPTLANGTGDTGDVYICNVAGTVNFGAGPITFAVGDYVIYSGTIWQRSSGAVGTVTSVAASITGNAIGITGSPVTTSGTLAFSFAGTGAQYIKGDGTLATFPSTIAQAERLITEVYNSTGATLTKGTIVYINGGQGNLPTVTKALATGDSTSAQTFGVVQADITNNNNGYVVVAGKLSDLDTQAYTEGTQLYLSSTTAGTWTSTKQYAPAHLVYVGIVVRSHPTQGIVEIKIQNGYELDEIHNVAAQTPTNNDGLFWESATSLWKNKSIATILGGTPVTGSGTLYALTKWGFTSGTIINSNLYDTGSVIYNNNATAGAFAVQFNGNATSGMSYGLLINAGSDANDIALRIQNVSSTSEYFFVYGDGKVKMNNIPNATTDTDTFLVSDGGYIKYRTGAQLLSDIGGQAALTNPVTGTGTTNYLPKFTGTSTIGNSLVYDNGTNVGIGTATPYSATNYKFLTIDGTNGSGFVTRVSSINSFLAYSNSGGTTLSEQRALPIVFETTGTSRMTLDASGNLGLGVTPSASTAKTIEVGFIGNSIIGRTTAVIDVASNTYFDSGYKYANNAAATLFQQNNGIYYWFNATSGTAGNAISFTQAMTLNASGELLVGTTSLATGFSTFAQFEVSASTGGILINSATNNIGRLMFTNNNASGGEGLIRYDGSNKSMQFWTNASEGMRLSSSGNLSIGNTNDTYKLDVSGTGRFTGNLTVSNGGYIQVNGSSNGYLNLNAANAGGNEAGIFYQIGGSNKWENYTAANDSALNWYSYGSSSIVFKLASTGAATFSSSVTANGLYANAGNSARFYRSANDYYWGIHNDSNNFLNFGTFAANGTAYGSNPKMILLDNGNVGIGTTSPASVLEIREGNRTNGSNITNFGVYTTTAQNTDVGGTIGLGGLFNGSDIAPFGSIRGGKENSTSGNYAGYLAFQTIANNSVLAERMRITSGGNVGIGTTSPAYRLDLFQSTGDFMQLYQNDGTYNRRLIITSATTGGNAGITMNATSSTGGDNFIFQAASTERMRITSGGQLLIGTTSSSGVDKVRVNNDGTTSYSTVNITNANSTANMYVGVGGSSVANSALQNNAYVWNAAASSLVFGTNDTERMRIKSNGIINLSNVPSSSAGLSSGDIYKTVAGVLMIV